MNRKEFLGLLGGGALVPLGIAIHKLEQLNIKKKISTESIEFNFYGKRYCLHPDALIEKEGKAKAGILMSFHHEND